MIDWFGHLYPYTNVHELNLDWVIATVKAGEKEIKNFVGLNTIKYADPILWDITSQYETNTVVVDGQTGNAYISVQPVPVGVALSRTEYWTAIFNYGNVVDTLMSQIASNEGLSPTATQAYNVNDLVFSQGLLYIVASPIIAGDSFVDGSNVNKTTVNEVIQSLRSNIYAEATARTNADNTLQGNIDAEATVRTDADNTLQGNIDAEATAREAADTQLGGRIDDEVTAREAADEELEEKINAARMVFNVVEYGATGDGTTDDTTAVLAAVTDCNIAGGCVYFPRGNYKLTQPLRFTHHSCSVKGENQQSVYLMIHHDNSGIIFGDGENTKVAMEIADISIINRGVPSDPQYGVFFNNTVNSAAYNCVINGFMRGVGLNHTGNTTLNFVGIVTDVASSTGFFVYNQSVSSSANNCYVGFSGAAADTGVGLSITNGDVADFTIKYLDVGNGAYGIYIDGSTSPVEYPPADIRIYDFVGDGMRVAGIYAANINDQGNILINGGWINPLANGSSHCIHFAGVKHATINGVVMQQLAKSTPVVNGVYLYSLCANIIIMACQFINLKICISNDVATYQPQIIGNSFTRYDGVGTVGSAIGFAGVDNGIYSNNFISGSFASGINITAGAYNIITHNNVFSGGINASGLTNSINDYNIIGGVPVINP